MILKIDLSYMDNEDLTSLAVVLARAQMFEEHEKVGNYINEQKELLDNDVETEEE
jgi:hypothetical protein